MITKIQPQQGQKQKNKTNFKSESSALIDNIPNSLKFPKKFIESQESLSYTRLIQDTATNWLPKAVFARSLADFGDMSFLEGVEDFIFYFSAPLLGQHVLKNLYPKLAPKNLQKKISEIIPEATKSILGNEVLKKSEIGKRAITTKAGMILACTAIPAAEYGLSFAKNLFTLKVFNKSDFNSIANLEHNQETLEHQENLKKSAKRHLIGVGLVSAVGLAVGTLFAAFGHKSNAVQKISEKILTPYDSLTKIINKLRKKPLYPEQEEYIKDVVNLDFRHKVDENGKPKLKLGQGFLGLTAISGFFGYKRAAKDRGKLDEYEVCTRVPIVVLYTIFGSDLFAHIYKNNLYKNHKYPDLINKNEHNLLNKVPDLGELKGIAEKIAMTRKTNPQEELNRLVKEKAKITAVPYIFGITFMGFLLAGITRFWTQYRFNHGIGNNNSINTKQNQESSINEEYKSIKPQVNYFSGMN